MVDEEDLYTLKINCMGKIRVGKANKGVNVEKSIIGFKKLKLWKREKIKMEEERKKRETPKYFKSPM